MKITFNGLGRVIVRHQLSKFRIRLTVGDQQVAADECGYLVTFEGLPGHEFYHHQSDKKGKHGYALSEARTGMRVFWHEKSNDAFKGGVARLDNFLTSKGRGAYERMLKQLPSVTELCQGFDGDTDNSKPEPYETEKPSGQKKRLVLVKGRA